MQINRCVYSERVNPTMAAFKGFAKTTTSREPAVPKDNPYFAMEKGASQAITQALDSYRKARDHAYESLFGAMFGLL